MPRTRRNELTIGRFNVRSISIDRTQIYTTKLTTVLATTHTHYCGDPGALNTIPDLSKPTEHPDILR